MSALFYGDDLTRELLGHFSASDKCSYRNHDVEERYKMLSLGRPPRIVVGRPHLEFALLYELGTV